MYYLFTVLSMRHRGLTFAKVAKRIHVLFFIRKKFIRKWGSNRQNLKKIVKKLRKVKKIEAQAK